MELNRERFVVTGGAGFIGSNIVRNLVKNKSEVTVIDNLITGKLDNISDIMDNIRFIRGNIQDLNLLRREFKNIDYVLHQAALPSVMRSIHDPIESNQNNVDGTLNVLIAARDANVKRFIYASSSSIYGNSPTLPKKEDMKFEPLSPYAVTKLVGEYYCKIFFEIYGLETVVLRYFNVFGPFQDPKSQYAPVIPRFITTMLKKGRPIIYGDGKQSRDFTYVQNNVEANLLACIAKEAAGKSFNIACGKRITLNGLIDMLNNILNSDIEPIYSKPRQGDVKHSLADINLAKDILGYEPRYDIEKGLKETVEWFFTLR